MEIVIGILNEDANFINQAGAQLFGLDVLRREFSDGRDETHPAFEALVREAVDYD
jgi:hypothetical protein